MKRAKQLKDAAAGDIVDCMNCGATRYAGHSCGLCGHPRTTTYRGEGGPKKRNRGEDVVTYFGETKDIDE